MTLTRTSCLAAGLLFFLAGVTAVAAQGPAPTETVQSLPGDEENHQEASTGAQALTFLGGGLLGTLLTLWLDRRKIKSDRTLDIVMEYLNLYGKIGNVKQILQGDTMSGSNRNLVAEVLDRYEFIAILIQHGYLDKTILQTTGITSDLCELYRQAASKPDLCSENNWPHLSRLRVGR